MPPASGGGTSPTPLLSLDPNLQYAGGGSSFGQRFATLALISSLGYIGYAYGLPYARKKYPKLVKKVGLK